MVICARWLKPRFIGFVIEVSIRGLQVGDI